MDAIGRTPHVPGNGVPTSVDRSNLLRTPATNAQGRALGSVFLHQLEAAASSIAATTDDEPGPSAGSAPDDGSLLDGIDPQALLGARLGADDGMSSAASQIADALARLGVAGRNPAATPAHRADAPAHQAAAPAGASARQNARVVAAAARRHGVDPALAVAMMLVESGGNNRAVGDGGTSFGLFQLHRGGMLTAAGLTSTQAFDPATNADVAMRALAHETKKGPNRSPGAIAAASQRPADPTGYAARVDATIARATALLR